jgi:hypothetical protein
MSSWKDGLVKCPTLFHSCLDIFMHQYVLNDDEILGKSKNMWFIMNYNIVGMFMFILYYGLKNMIWKE